MFLDGTALRIRIRIKSVQTLRAIAVVCVMTAVPSVATAQDVARGIVFVDQDGDGRHDPGEPPLPDVRVSLAVLVRPVLPSR